MDKEEKAILCLSCFTSLENATEAVHGNIVVSEDLLSKEKNIPSTVLEKEFNLEVIMPFLTKKALSIVQSQVQNKVTTPTWLCGTCRKRIGGKRAIICERCLVLSHFDCTKLSKKPVSDWFCRLGQQPSK